MKLSTPSMRVPLRVNVAPQVRMLILFVLLRFSKWSFGPNDHWIPIWRVAMSISSITIRNNKGDRMHPWRTLLEHVNGSDRMHCAKHSILNWRIVPFVYQCVWYSLSFHQAPYFFVVQCVHEWPDRKPAWVSLSVVSNFFSMWLSTTLQSIFIRTQGSMVPRLFSYCNKNALKPAIWEIFIFPYLGKDLM